MKAMLKGVTKGLPQTGIQGGTGVGVFYLHRALSNKIPFLQNHPLAAPIGFIVLGHVLKKSKKLGTLGPALIGAGGYAGAQVHELQKATAVANTPSAPAAGTSGVEENDTGMVVPPHEVGMLLQSHDISGEMNAPSVGSSYQDAHDMASY